MLHVFGIKNRAIVLQGGGCDETVPVRKGIPGSYVTGREICFQVNWFGVRSRGFGVGSKNVQGSKFKVEIVEGAVLPRPIIRSAEIQESKLESTKILLIAVNFIPGNRNIPFYLDGVVKPLRQLGRY
jgi:hypothetical protein